MPSRLIATLLALVVAATLAVGPGAGPPVAATEDVQPPSDARVIFAHCGEVQIGGAGGSLGATAVGAFTTQDPNRPDATGTTADFGFPFTRTGKIRFIVCLKGVGDYAITLTPVNPATLLPVGPAQRWTGKVNNGTTWTEVVADDLDFGNGATVSLRVTGDRGIDWRAFFNRR
jgi:hypothetical protein